MAISLKHSKTSAKTDSADATLVQPSDWNAEHTLTAAQDTVLGRVSAGTGAIEEITVTAAGRAILDDADATAQRATIAAAGTGVANTFAGKQLFSGDANANAPLSISASGTPTTLANGDLWFASNRLTYRQASTSYTVPRNDAVTTWSAVQTFTASPVINVTDNTNAALRITQAGTGNALLVEDEANPDSTPFAIDAAGNVLVGTTTGLAAGTGTGRLQIASAGSNQLWFSRYSNDTSASSFAFTKSRGLTVGSNVAVVAGDDLGYIEFRGYNGSAYTTTAAIQADVETGTISATSLPSHLRFFTTPDGSVTNVERFRLGPAGQVGIGGATYGTSGQVLTSGGASAAPSWADVSANSMTLLGTITTTSGASQSLSGLTLTSYKQLLLVIRGVSHNSGTSQSLLVGTSTTDDIAVTNVAGNAFFFFGQIWIDLDTGSFCSVPAAAAAATSSSNSSVTFAGDLTITNASTVVSVAPLAGSFDAGSILVYGVK